MSEQNDDRIINLSDDDAAIVFTGDGSLRFYQRVTPHEYDHIPAVAMLMLTGESDLIKQAIELLYKELDARIDAKIAAQNILLKAFQGMVMGRNPDGPQ